jgi:3-phenylpropionate/trans-cinnamate dioxygenase ferredoxin reductase subunit
MGIEMSELNKIVVVGSSLAGLRSMEALRREGFAGELVALSAESHMPYDRPPLSKRFLKGEWDEQQITLRRQGFDDLDVDWRLGCEALRLDTGARQLELKGGDSLAYDGLVIATGSRARRLPFGEELEGLHVLRNLDDARTLRDALQRSPRVAVVGGGFIGMEAAASARELGLEVTVIEPLEQPLLRGLGSVLGSTVAEHHREHGIDVRCGVGVEGFEGSGWVEELKLTDGTRLEADVVIVGIGIEPCCEWLEDSGLQVDDGVVCDAKGATGVEGVVAAGDVARWANPLTDAPRRYEHWTAAVEQAAISARRLLHGDAAVEPFAHVPYVWSDQFELRLAMAGEVTPGAEMYVGRGALGEERWLALFGEGGKLTGAVSQKRPRFLQECRDQIAEGMSFADAIAAHP